MGRLTKPIEFNNRGIQVLIFWWTFHWCCYPVGWKPDRFPFPVYLQGLVPMTDKPSIRDTLLHRWCISGKHTCSAQKVSQIIASLWLPGNILHSCCTVGYWDNISSASFFLEACTPAPKKGTKQEWVLAVTAGSLFYPSLWLSLCVHGEQFYDSWQQLQRVDSSCGS
jgi:hypothetical protein